jgi:GT2 family glycosyltransferase
VIDSVMGLPRDTAPDRYAVLRPAIGPVRVDPGNAADARWRIRAVIPCHNRRRDVELLLADLATLRIDHARARLFVCVVDNASDAPLSDLAPLPGLHVRHLRLDRNTGGSGGFNAGMRAALAAGIPHDTRELVWLLDSDARVEPDVLGPLLDALEQDENLVAAASALADPETGEVFEAGGFIDRRTGEYVQPRPIDDTVRPVEYAAACSLLVRRWAVEQAGLMADVFVSGDDVEWCLRLAGKTGGRIAVAPRSRARHPRPDRMRTWSRYYAARNAFAAIAAARCGTGCRFRRAIREVARAACQTMMGRDDLAELHLRGLEDASRGTFTGPMPPDLTYERARGLDELGTVIREAASGRGLGRAAVGPGLETDEKAITVQLRRLAIEPFRIRRPERPRWSVSAVLRGLRRLLTGPPADVAVVSPRGVPEDWLAGRIMVMAWSEGFVVRRIRRLDRACRLAAVLLRGGSSALRLAIRTPHAPPGQACTVPPPAPPSALRAGALSVIVLSHNRWPVLERTLNELSRDPAVPPRGFARVLVVDNASDDESPLKVRERFPRAEVLALDANVGVEAYNEGVRRANTEFVLILDDDSWPEPGVIDQAADLLARRPDLAAVALHPRHPVGGRSEWPFALDITPTDRWPFMSCGNLVRRDAWLRVGGYEKEFFLYRNDTDLALKLLAAGMGVHFNPEWVVWHDSRAATRKSRQWFRLATRNWIWMCRRHGRGFVRLSAAVKGWAWAHRLAGVSIPAHGCVLRGAADGLLRRPPRIPAGVTTNGSALRLLLDVRHRHFDADPGGMNNPSSDLHSA